MKWIISSDHAGASLKEALCSYLEEVYGYFCVTFGAKTENDKYDYPDAVDEALSVYEDGDYCIFICGTGVGISMRANRYNHIRAALIYDLFSAQSAKEHNNANALCFGARTQKLEDIQLYLSAFISSKYEGGRHVHRLEKLSKPTA